MSKPITDDDIKRFARGELPDHIRMQVADALGRDPELAARARLWRALPDAVDYPQPSEARWARIRRETLNALDADARPTPRFSGILRPALVGVLALVLIAAVAALGRPKLSPEPIHSARSWDAIAPLPLAARFDTGSSEGQAVSLAVTVQSSENPSESKDKTESFTVSPGDTLRTHATQWLSVTLGERATLTLAPDSALHVRAYKGRSVPYLGKGRVTLDIRHDESEAFVLLLPMARLIDVGTRFAVALTGDAAELDVAEGAVRVERPDVPPLVLREGQSTRFSPGSGPTRANERPGLKELYDGAKKSFTPETPPPQPREQPPATAPSDAERPEKKAPAPAETLVREGEVVTEKTSWQLTLESLSTPEQDALAHFYGTVDEQMRSGRTLSAIQNLRNFIEQNPGPVSEKARYLLAEAHFNLEEFKKAQDAYLSYIRRYPQGAWIEMARLRFAMLNAKRKQRAH